MSNRLLEIIKCNPGAVPIDTNGAACNGDWINMANFKNCVIKISQGAWAGGTPAVTLNQATDNAGTGSKALAFDQYYQYTALTGDTPTKTTVVSNTFNLPATANTFTFFEIHNQDLDAANGFNFFQVSIASPGANADLICVDYILGGSTFSGKPEGQQTAIA